jgi:hypothetical protein
VTAGSGGAGPVPTVADEVLKLVAPLLVAGGDDVANYVAAHGDEFAAKLAPWEGVAIDKIAAEVEAAIPRQGLLERAEAGTIVATIQNLANELIAQRPEINADIVNAIVTGAAAVAAKGAAAEGET